MKDVFSIIQQLTGIGSDSFKSEERIIELRPIDYILDYYTSPMKGYIGPKDKKEFVIEWKDEDGRIKEIERYNAMINRYNAEIKNNEDEFIRLFPVDGKGHSPSELNYNEPIDDFDSIPLWAFNCIPKLSRDKNSRSGPLVVDDEELFRMLYFVIEDRDIFVKRFNKMIFDHICEMLHQAVELGQYNEKSIWFDPSIGFLNWFQAKGIDHKSTQPLIKGKRKNRGGRKKGSSPEMVSRIMWIRDKYQILKDKDSGENDKERAELIVSEISKLKSSGKLPEFFKGSDLKETTVHKYIKTKYWKSITPKE